MKEVFTERSIWRHSFPGGAVISEESEQEEEKNIWLTYLYISGKRHHLRESR